jgi:tetratricopeptide (TPR) repeat protein
LVAFERIFEHLHEAETLAKALGDQGRLGWAWAYTAQGWSQMGELDRALEAGQRALSIATDLEDFGLNLITNYVLGIVCQYLGDHRRAVDLFGKNVDALQGERIREFFGQTGLPAVVHRALIAGSLAELGAFAEGIARGEAAISIAEAVDHPYSRALAYWNVGYLYLRKGELQKAISVLEGGLELCRVANFPSVLGRFASHLGYGYALSGRLAEALPLLEQAVGRAATPGNLPRHSLFVACLSEGYLLASRTEEAITQAQLALVLSRAQKGRGFEAWTLRLLGEIAARCDPPEAERAELHYQQALVLAEELGMRPLQAHCHLGLGKLYRKVRRYDEASVELATAIELYRAMEMTFWLPQVEDALVQTGSAGPVQRGLG